MICVVLVEVNTKFAILRATKYTKTAPVLRRRSLPLREQRLCRDNSKHIATIVATPRANGQIERYNSTLLAALSTSLITQPEWKGDFK